jgi:hypothetical protein
MADEERPFSKTFDGLMERARSETYGWLVSFDGKLFYQVPEMPRLGNVEQMERLVADKSALAGRHHLNNAEVEIVTVVSNRRDCGN